MECLERLAFLPHRLLTPALFFHSLVPAGLKASYASPGTRGGVLRPSLLMTSMAVIAHWRVTNRFH